MPGLRGLSGSWPFAWSCGRGVRVELELLRDRVEVLDRGWGNSAAVGERVEGRVDCNERGEHPPP